MQYFSKTGGKLKYRFIEHLRDIRKSKDFAEAVPFINPTTSHRTSLLPA